MEQEKKRAQFSELPEAKKKIVSKRCYDVTLECNFRGSVIKEKYTFASSQFILDKAKYYVDNFATASEKMKYFNAKNIYDNLSKSNGIYYRQNTIYQQHIEAINKIDDMEELDKYIKGKNPSNKEIPLHSLNLAISDRTRALGDIDGLYSGVSKKLIAYGKYKYEKREKQNKEKSKFTLEENKLLAKLTLQDFLASEFIYKQEYCNDKNLSVNTFDKRMSNVKEFDPQFYEKYQNDLEKKRKDYYISLTPIVKEIIKNIKEKPEYTHIDYYLAYKDLYKFEDLYQSCNLAKLDIKTLKSFLSTAELRNSLNYESFRNQYYCVYNHEFNDEEKEEIYKFAKENKIPFNWKNVSLIVAKQYKDQAKNLNKTA